MNFGRMIFSQLMDFLPRDDFHRCVQRYSGNHNIQTFSCFDQYLCMAFAQLTGRESLRDIEVCLRTFGSKLYHAGFWCKRISRNTLANANRIRSWKICADFAQHLIAEATKLYADTDLGFDLDNTIYALDSTTIDLCLSLFPWATFRRTKSAVKMHTLLNLKGSIPEFIHISEGSVHDVKAGGWWNCSSNGSSNTCESNSSSARIPMLSRHRFGLPSRCTCWLQLSKSVWLPIRASTESYRS